MPLLRAKDVVPAIPDRDPMTGDYARQASGHVTIAIAVREKEFTGAHAAPLRDSGELSDPLQDTLASVYRRILKMNER